MPLVTLRQRLHLFLAGHTGLTWVSVTLLWSSMKHLGSHSDVGSFFGCCRAAGCAVLKEVVIRALFALLLLLAT